MNGDVRVVVDRKKAVTGASVNVPLLFAGSLDREVPYTECFGYDEVEALFGAQSKLTQAAALVFMQELPPEKVAVFGSAGRAVASLPAVWEKNWRQLLVCTEEGGGDDLQGISALVEAQGDKVLFASVEDLDEIGGANSITKYERVFCLYDPEGEGYAAAVLGASAGREPGSFTYKNLRIAGVNPYLMTEASLGEVEEAGCVTVVKKAGDTVTSEGLTAGGEYLDIVDAKDYIVREIEYRTQKLLNNSPKVPYDNNGIAMLESVCVNVLAGAFTTGMIAMREDGGGDYTVTYAPRSETKEEDREQRRYVEGRFSFALAGAVHTAKIFGTIVI